MTKISVCMATHNGARYIRPQLASVLPQLGADDEVVVSDDGSSDETLALIAAHDDERIRVIRNEHSGNPAKVFESALSACQGDLIFLADQDDVWMDQKVSQMKQALSDCDLVLCDCVVTDQDLRVLSPSFFAANGTRRGLLYNLLRNCYIGCCMAFRRDVLLAALPFPATLPAHDVWLGLVAEKYFRVRFLPVPLVYLRRHYTNHSTTGTKSDNTFYQKVSSRLLLARELIRR